MRIAVYGGTGMIGSRIVSEAASRGHQVTAISRKGDASAASGVTALAGSAADTAFTTKVAADHDVVVSAVGPSRTGDDGRAFYDTIANLAGTLDGTRLVVVGGAGSLEVDGVALVDSPGFPEAYKSEARKARETLQFLRGTGPEVDWTYLSPAPEIAPGERTGHYQVADDNPAGSFVTAEDYAVALVDEIERPAHRRARFTIAN